MHNAETHHALISPFHTWPHSQHHWPIHANPLWFPNQGRYGWDLGWKEEEKEKSNKEWENKRKRGERVCEAKETREGLCERNKWNGIFFKILSQQMMLTLATSLYSVEVRRIFYKVKHERFKYHKQNYIVPLC